MASQVLQQKEFEKVLYPKLTLSFTLRSPNAVASYLCVSLSIDGENENLGKTETVIPGDQDAIHFTSTFDVVYFVGLEDNQFLVLTVMDGDTMQISRGYSICEMVIPIGDVIRKINEFPIILGGRKDSDNTWGHIVVRSIIGTALVTIDFKTHHYSSRFFRSVPPTIESIRKRKPFFLEKNGFYQISLNCAALYDSIGNQNDGKESKIAVVKLCVHNPSISSIKSILSPKLQCIWKSKNITKHPFLLKAVDVPFTHEDLTGNANNLIPVSKQVLLIVQVFFQETMSSEPILSSYCAVRVASLLRQEDEDIPVSLTPVRSTSADGSSKRKKAIAAAALGGGAGLSTMFMKDTLKRVDSFEEEMNELVGEGEKSKEADVSSGSGGSGDDRDGQDGDHIKGGVVEGGITEVIFEIGRRGNRRKTFASRLQLIIKCKYDYTKVKSFPGDDFYEQKLSLLLENKQLEWFSNMDEAIDLAMEMHETNCSRTISLLTRASEGWQLTPSFIIDMSAACLQSLLISNEELQQGKSTAPAQSSFAVSKGRPTQTEKSLVLDAISTCYHSMAPFCEKNSVAVFAGGGVKSPLPGFESYNFTRNVGFPLCQELLLSCIDTSMMKMLSIDDDTNQEKGCIDAAASSFSVFNMFDAAASSSNDSGSVERVREETIERRAALVRRTAAINKRYQLLRELLDGNGALKQWIAKVDPTGLGWMATKYVDSTCYCDKTALTQGFVEATAIYLPTLPSLRNRNSNKGLQIQDTRNDTTKGGGDVVRTELMQYGQTDKTSDISSSTSGGEKEDPIKLTEAQKEAMSFQRLQLRKQLCYIGHGNVGDSGNSIWSGMTTMDVWTSLGSRLRPHVFTGHPRRNNNMDVHAVEVLLSRSMQDTSSSSSSSFASALKMNSKNPNSKTINLVVWLLGKCPSREDMEKISLLMEFQATKPIGNSAFLVVLAAEPRYDLEYANTESGTALLMKALGHPFEPLLQCYQKVEKRSKQKNRESMAASKIRNFGFEMTRLKLIHFMTWSEVMAQAYELDDEHLEQQHQQQIKSEGIHFFDITAQAKSILPPTTSNKPEIIPESTSIPTIGSLRKVLADFLPAEVMDIVLRSEEDSEISTKRGNSGGRGGGKGGYQDEEGQSDSEENSITEEGSEADDGVNGMMNAMTKSVRLAGDFLSLAWASGSTGSPVGKSATTAESRQSAINRRRSKRQPHRDATDEKRKSSTSSKKEHVKDVNQVRSFKQVSDMKVRFDREMKILMKGRIKQYISLLVEDVATKDSTASGASPTDSIPTVATEVPPSSTTTTTTTTTSGADSVDSSCVIM